MGRSAWKLLPSPLALNFHGPQSAQSVPRSHSTCGVPDSFQILSRTKWKCVVGSALHYSIHSDTASWNVDSVCVSSMHRDHCAQSCNMVARSRGALNPPERQRLPRLLTALGCRHMQIKVAHNNQSPPT